MLQSRSDACRTFVSGWPCHLEKSDKAGKHSVHELTQVDTMETKRVMRRKHSAQFRAEVLQACGQADASVAAIALRNGLNANVVYRWLREEARGVEAGADSHAAVSTARHGAEFIAVQLPAAVAAALPEIRVEVRRPGAATVTVSWPVQYASECAAWLREWLR